MKTIHEAQDLNLRIYKKEARKETATPKDFVLAIILVAMFYFIMVGILSI